MDQTQQAFNDYKNERVAHWDKVFSKTNRYIGNKYYHKRLQQVYRYLIPEGARVLEVGCGDGSLLSSLRPSFGLGIDFSEKAIELARRNSPHLSFQVADIHKFDINECFDFIVLSNVVNEFWDVQTAFKQIKKGCHSQTRIIMDAYSRLWEMPLTVSRKMGLATPLLRQSWLTPEDITNLCALTDLEVFRNWQEILIPANIPLLTPLCNRVLVHIWPFNVFSLAHVFVARPLPEKLKQLPPSVSVIIPARNEAGNIQNIFDRMPRFGSNLELVFVEGNSSDDTYSSIEAAIQRNSEWQCQLFKQPGKGKGDAVRLGFEKAKNDIVMILDADLTVAPEDLPKFYDALATGKADFINGVRLVYPMHDNAMRFLNLLGNKFFSLCFSWLFGQPIKDTLCGTKVLWKKDYEKIRDNRAYFGDFDPFGDFDLLFGAVKMNFKIIDMPIRYGERTYGTTNISRWKHGFLLLRMAAFACKRIKFV